MGAERGLSGGKAGVNGERPRLSCREFGKGSPAKTDPTLSLKDTKVDGSPKAFRNYARSTRQGWCIFHGRNHSHILFGDWGIVSRARLGRLGTSQADGSNWPHKLKGFP